MDYKNILIGLLEKLGYCGIDASIEESLYFYGMVIKYDIDERYLNTIICNQDENNFLFDFTDISKDDVREAIDDMKDGFFSYVGLSKEEYIKQFNSHDSYIIFAYDIQQYNGYIFDECCCYYQELTEKEIVKVLISRIKYGSKYFFYRLHEDKR